MMQLKAFLIVLVLLLTTKLFGQERSVAQNRRVSPLLQSTLSKKFAPDSIDLIVAAKNINATSLEESRLLHSYLPGKTIIIRAKISKIPILINDSSILFIDELRKPKEELTTGAFDLSTNKINLAHHNYPSINGNEIKISIKEQQFDTTDIDIRGRHFNSGVGATTQFSHASIMATIIAGGGNSSPYATGAAPNAQLTSADFSNLLPEDDAVYKNFDISIQNHSYGTAIENFYGADAAAYDRSVWQNPALAQVFSAGNSGTSTAESGLYAGVSGWANLTGSFKMAKNSIVVGHIDSFYNLLPLSSRGPAFDGRVKPDLVAYGEDGSSGAAALVSGSLALLQQAYKKNHNQLPAASLIKAVLLNSADEVGATGIDYASGYGSLNTAAALHTILENHFWEAVARNNEIKRFPLSIPPDVAQLKVTLAWSDTAAEANAPAALVNDLDVVLKNNSSGEEWLPWVLNPAPNNDSLIATAVRKRDTLNNVEQLTIDRPEAGTYILIVKGSKIVTQNQAFSIAYQYDTLNNFSWTYPTASDLIKGGKTNVLRWQTNIPGNAVLEFSINNSWQLLDTIDLQNSYYRWNTPDTFTTAILRIRIPFLNRTIPSDSFLISRATDLQVGFNCVDSFLLFWNRLPTSQYQLYQLGNQYLQPVLQTRDTFHIFQQAQAPSLYYSIAPLINNKAGLKSFTIKYTDQGVGCYIRTFSASLQNNKALLSADLGSIYGITAVSFQKLTSTGVQTIQTLTPVTATSFTAIDASLKRGVNDYRLLIQLANGQTVYSTVESVIYFPDLPVIVYPNPAFQNQPIKITVNNPFTYAIKIYDGIGRLVQTKSLDGFNSQLPSFLLPKGIYFIKILSQDGTIGTQKLVVQ